MSLTLKPHGTSVRGSRTSVIRAAFFGLAFAAGYLDAISFLRLGNVFTANMTANTALLGIILGTHLGSVDSGVPLAPQLLAMLALAVGAFAAAPYMRGNFDARRAALLTLSEGSLVALASAVFTWVDGALVAPLAITLLSAAMGAQSVLAVKAGAPGVSTAYTTGTVATAIMRTFRIGNASQYGALAAHDALGWVLYLAGAVIGALVLTMLHARAMWPVIAVFLIAAFLFGRGR